MYTYIDTYIYIYIYIYINALTHYLCGTSAPRARLGGEILAPGLDVLGVVRRVAGPTDLASILHLLLLLVVLLLLSLIVLLLIVVVLVVLLVLLVLLLVCNSNIISIITITMNIMNMNIISVARPADLVCVYIYIYRHIMYI